MKRYRSVKLDTDMLKENEESELELMGDEELLEQEILVSEENVELVE